MQVSPGIHRIKLPITLSDGVLMAVLKLNSIGCSSLVVGGAVRDAILGIQPKDIDIEAYGISYKDLESILSRYGKVDIVGKSFGIIKFTDKEGGEYDFSLPRRESKTGIGHRGFDVHVDKDMTPRDAAERRDFTFNSLAYDTVNHIVYDYYGGLEDLNNRVLRHTSDKFEDDPLRILRAMQFQARFDMDIAPDTASLMKLMVENGAMDELPKERISEEWMKWAIKGKKLSRVFDFIHATGLDCVIPYIGKLKGVEQDVRWHPEGDVEVHTGHVLNEAVRVADRECLYGDNRAVLIFSALCHDFAKPQTTEKVLVNGEERITSKGHEKAGGKLAQEFLEYIGIKNDIIDRVVPLVENHLEHVNISAANESGRVKATKKLSVRLEDATIKELLYLVESDSSGRPPLPKGLPESGRILKDLADKIGVSVAPEPNIITGKYLISIGVKPGVEMGNIIKAARDAQEDGEFNDLESGGIWVSDFIGKKFEKGGEINEDESEKQLYIDILSDNSDSPAYQKYKDILKSKFNIDFDAMYKGQDIKYIKEANLNDIKSSSDFLSYDNWSEYARKISEIRGFIPMNLYDVVGGEVSDSEWDMVANELGFEVEKVPYIDRGVNGDVARAFASKVYYTEFADLYYLLHEIGHVYDFKNSYEGLAKNPAYSPTKYGTMNAGECFAENFAIYFIAPMDLKRWNSDVYEELDSRINDDYKIVLGKMVGDNNKNTPMAKGGGVKGKKIVHFTDQSPDDFKVDKSRVGLWFTSNQYGYPLRRGAKNKIERYINPNELKLATEKEANIAGGGDFNKGAKALKQSGYDGVKVYNNDNYEYLIFDVDRLASVYGSGGLIAPNGKKSNLTPEQYKLVRTPEFKAWFGDWENDPDNSSKVVDENGEPLVVYHGTKAEFDEFDKNKRGTNTDNGLFGKGFYFTKNEKTAQSYGEKVKNIYLSIKNPFRINDFKTKSEMAKHLGVDESILREGGTGIGVYNEFSGVFSDALKEKGYDGVITKYGEYVVFDKSQIKAVEQSLKETPKEETTSKPIVEEQKVSDVKEGSVGVGVDSVSIKTIKQLESENKTTLPKVPTKNVFSNDVENLTKEQRGNADNFIGTEKENELPTETVSVKDIIPTQKNLTIPNLEKVSKIKEGTKIDEPIILIKKDGKYYVADGHHRIASEILKGNTNVEAKIYDEQSLKEQPKSEGGGTNGSNILFDSNNPDIRYALGGNLSKTPAPKKGSIHDKSKSGKYTQDDDLISELEYSVKSYSGGGRITSSRLMVPNVRGGWTKDKILRYLKEYSSDTASTYTLEKFISDFDSWEQLKDHLYYHGTTNYIQKGLKPSIAFSVRFSENQGGGGYGERYWGISLTKRKKTAESFSGTSNSVTVYPVFLKKDAKVIEMLDIKDSSEIEEIIVELYENNVDAVWIGGGEEELVVVNPGAILLYSKGGESFRVYGGFKSKSLTDDEIKKIYDESKKLWETYSKEYSQKTNKDERSEFINSIKTIQFNNGGDIVAAEDSFPISELNKLPKGRLHNTEESKKNLKDDISKNGIKEPLILVYYVKDNALRLKEGHHRLDAANKLGMKDAPVKVQVEWSRSIKDDDDINGQELYYPPLPLDVEGYKKRNYQPSNIELIELGFKEKPFKGQSDVPDNLDIRYSNGGGIGVNVPSLQDILGIIKNHPLVSYKGKVYEGYIVGSFARGKANDSSDIDILLKIPPQKGLTADEFTDKQRLKIRKYFIDNDIQGIRNDLHPQWDGRRVDLYFTYEDRLEDAIKLPKNKSEEPVFLKTRTGMYKFGGFVHYLPNEENSTLVDVVSLESAGFGDILYSSPENVSEKRIKDLNRFLNKNENNLFVLYHGTSDNIDVINEGLKRTSYTRRRSLMSESGYVYLSPFKDTAKTFGEMGNPYGGKVYEVKIPVRLLKPDTDQLSNLRLIGEKVGDTLAESIIFGRSVRVKGNIPPYMINISDSFKNGGDIKEAISAGDIIHAGALAAEAIPEVAGELLVDAPELALLEKGGDVSSVSPAIDKYIKSLISNFNTGNRKFYHGYDSEGNESGGSGSDFGAAVYWAKEQDYAEVFGDLIVEASIEMDNVLHIDDKGLRKISKSITGDSDWMENEGLFSVLKEKYGVNGIYHSAEDETEDEFVDWTFATNSLIPENNFEKGGLTETYFNTEETKEYLRVEYPKRLTTWDTISKESDAYADSELEKMGLSRYSPKDEFGVNGLSKFFVISGKKRNELDLKYNKGVPSFGSGLVSVYVRLGLPPVNKRRKFVGSTGYNGQIELNGISVFNAGYDPESGYIVVDTGGNALTMDWDEGLAQGRKIYLIEGTEMDEEGYDGEPLLSPSTANIIGEVDPDTVLPDLSIFDGEAASGKEVDFHPIRDIFKDGGVISGAKKSIAKRVKGDALLDAEDLVQELYDNKAAINPDGTVTLYHRTTNESCVDIINSGVMYAKEDGVFFSTKEYGQADGYGDCVLKFNIPVEKLELDDTFGEEAHVRVPVKMNSNGESKPLNVSDWIVKDDQYLLLKYKNGGKISFSQISHLKSKGLVPKFSVTRKTKNMDNQIALPDVNSNYDSLKQLLKNQGYDLIKINDNNAGGLSDGKTVADIAKQHNVDASTIESELQKGIEVEMEHTNDKDVAKKIALDHLVESPKYYDYLSIVERAIDMEDAESSKNLPAYLSVVCSEFPYTKTNAGKNLVTSLEMSSLPRDAKVTAVTNILQKINRLLKNKPSKQDEIALNGNKKTLEYYRSGMKSGHKDFSVFRDGGVVVGKRHSECDGEGCGEKFKVESTGQVVELEGGEGVLSDKAMHSDVMYDFNGKQMTGRQIASFLNHKYGGVKFEKGGDVPCSCMSHKKFYHGGEVSSAVVNSLSGGEAVVTVKTMESDDKYEFEGREMTPRKILSVINQSAGGRKFEEGGTILASITKEVEKDLMKMSRFVQNLLYYPFFT